MGANAGERIIHGYDTTARRVLCGTAQQASSTKHFAAVTCTACRALIERSLVEAPQGPIDPRGG